MGGFKAPSKATGALWRGAIVDQSGNPTPIFQRWLSQMDAKTSQTLSLAGNVTLNNVVQATPTTLNPTTSSIGLVDMPEMDVTITTKGNPILVLFSAVVSNNTGGKEVVGFLMLDGVLVNNAQWIVTSSNINESGMAVLAYLSSPSPGTHIFKIQWGTTGGTATSAGLARNLQTIELG